MQEETPRTAAAGTEATRGTDGATGNLPVTEWFDLALHWTTLCLEAAGILVIVAGAVIATVYFVVTARRGDSEAAYHVYRTRLARGILLGLEFLVAADIIGTVAVDPTLDNLLVLGLIVLIRTFLSFSLEVEIEGRWPWQRGHERSSP
ncbi:MAG TPA: DUF1622 domain-containing protein [Arenibaculum sp.]|nr:DUF1622 domain-containing protein [Arenibaculum sp.]